MLAVIKRSAIRARTSSGLEPMFLIFSFRALLKLADCRCASAVSMSVQCRRIFLSFHRFGLDRISSHSSKNLPSLHTNILGGAVVFHDGQSALRDAPSRSHLLQSTDKNSLPFGDGVVHFQNLFSLFLCELLSTADFGLEDGRFAILQSDGLSLLFDG